LEHFTEELILQYMYVYNEIYKDMCFEGTYLNKGILKECVISMGLDLLRIKAFHKIINPDSHKQAAYTIKWLIKLRPIQIINGTIITEPILLANEFFAIGAGLNHLNIDMNEMSDKYLLNLVYTLHYRPIIGEVLASKIYLLEKAIKKEIP